MSNKFLNEDYLNKIKAMPCIGCVLEFNISTEDSSHPHHESVSKMFSNYKRNFDYGLIPLCAFHHNQRHMVGRKSFWKAISGIDYFEFYLVIQLLLKYIVINKIVLSDGQKDLIESYNYLGEGELRELIDSLAKTIHNQYFQELS